jgi:hypothetical protein
MARKDRWQRERVCLEHSRDFVVHVFLRSRPGRMFGDWRPGLRLRYYRGGAMNIATQTDQILAHLKNGGTLTPLEALDKFGCFRLGARIWDLKREGHEIQTEFVSVGNQKKVARYRMSWNENAPVVEVHPGRLGTWS